MNKVNIAADRETIYTLRTETGLRCPRFSISHKLNLTLAEFPAKWYP